MRIARTTWQGGCQSCTFIDGCSLALCANILDAPAHSNSISHTSHAASLLFAAPSLAVPPTTAWLLVRLSLAAAPAAAGRCTV